MLGTSPLYSRPDLQTKRPAAMQHKEHILYAVGCANRN